MKKRALIPLSVWLCVLPFSIHAQAARDSELSAVNIELGTLREGTVVRLKMSETVASNTFKRGDRFGMEVADAVIVDGHEWIQAGAPAVGEVIDAAKSAPGGRPGRLILAARFVVAKDQTIKLHSFTAGTGEDRSAVALGTGIATLGISTLFISGKNIVVPKGTDVFAKIATDYSPSAIVDPH